MNKKSKGILKESVVIDALFHGLLTDTPIETDDKITIVDMLLNGGVTAISDTVVDDNHPSNFNKCCIEMWKYYLLQDTLPDQVKIAKTSKDIRKAKEEGKLAVIMSTQGADCFEQDYRYVSILNMLGLKIVQLTYNHQGILGSGVYEPVDGGITRFGQQCINEMNRVGMLIDLSHVGYRTTMDTMEASIDPVIFSHSGCKSLNNHIRNANDEQIKAIGKNKGVLCLCPHSVMIEESPGEWPDVDRFIDHILHAVNLTSIDNVGVGTDRWKRSNLTAKMGRMNFNRSVPGWFGAYNDEKKQVKGFNYFDKWENFVERMLARGFSETDIKKVLGGNLMRVFEQVWDKNL